MKAKGMFKNLICYGTTTIGIMHFINQIIYQNSKAPNSLSKENAHYYDSRIGRIFYTVHGDGSPLLLIHDLDVSSSSYEWSNVITGLSKKHTVYAIDLLGCGRSDKSNLIYTNYLYVQLITDFIKNIIKNKTDVIASGHSSAFTVMSCLHSNSLIGKVILLNPEGLISGQNTNDDHQANMQSRLLGSLLNGNKKINQKYTKIIKYIFMSPVIGRFIYNMHINKDKIEKTFYQKYYYDLEKIPANIITAYYKSSQRQNAKGKYLHLSMLCGFMNYNISSDLEKLENEISIMIGASDPNNLANAIQYQNHLPDVTIRKIEHTKYLPQLESPDEFVTTAEALL